jgi:hypothetical protein
MFWSIKQPSGPWLPSDILYAVGLGMLVWGLWASAKNRDNGWIILLLSWMGVLLSFLIRFVCIFTAMCGDETLKPFALARSVLHTLIAPLLILVVWCFGRLIYEQGVRRRKWWQTGLWMVLLLACAFFCGVCFYFLNKYFGAYPRESDLP